MTREPGIRYSVPIANHSIPFMVSNYYITVTLNNLTPKLNRRTRPNRLINEFMFYRGKRPLMNVRECVDRQDIFSFTPTRILNSCDYNKRCKIDLSALNTRLQHLKGFRNFSSRLSQGHKTVVFNASQTDVATIWREVRNAVLNASFMLGCHFAW